VRSVSFDLYFLERRPGQTWQDAFAALDGGAEGRAFGEEEESRWRAVEAALRTVIPDADLFVGEDNRELSDEATGLQLSMFVGEISLSVPYWYEGPEAERMTETLKAVARAVEEATGLVAFDPQADAPFLDGGDTTAASTFQEVHDSLVSRGIRTGEAAPPPRPKRPFWRRLFRS